MKEIWPCKKSDRNLRIKTNSELKKTIYNKNIINFIKSSRHMVQASTECKIIYKWKPMTSQALDRLILGGKGDIKEHEIN